ncbi:MAG: GNAT family N-acetyltransferase [Chloroflexota bacterium]
MLQVKSVTKHLLDKCRNFLTQDLTGNVLVLGDCYSPLLEASTLYCACDSNEVVGVCSVFHGFSKPAVALGASSNQVKRLLLETALNEVEDEFISIIPVTEFDFLMQYASLVDFHYEQQMVTNTPHKVNDINEAVRVSEDELSELNNFYIKECSPGWIPLQFKVGPVYCVKQEGSIVSAAGVHICTPYIAQLGNIVTEEAYRNRGFASACTSALTMQLAVNNRIVSLYVKINNRPAIHVYEKLSFNKKREVIFVTMRKKAAR